MLLSLRHYDVPDGLAHSTEKPFIKMRRVISLATRVAFELTQRILWQHLDDFVLVSENEMLQAIDLYVEKAHTGQPAALLLSGGNITVEQLLTALAS